MTRREEILRATSEAARIYANYPTGKRTSFDIVGAVTQLNIPLLFRPLKGLLGAVIALDNRLRGILITTERDLHIQRFTLAHELGHVLLGHTYSLDDEIDLAGRNASNSRPAKEVAADTFASELLGPKDLLVQVAQKHQWTRKALHEPKNIYQLSLRLGLSYEATCWALVGSKVLKRQEVKEIKDKPVRDLKRALAPEEMITNSWANVWALNKADTGCFLEAGPGDLFAVYVQDHASSGYLWRLVDAGAGAEIVDECSQSIGDTYGQDASRIIYVRFTTPGVHQLIFEHARPWSGSTIDQIEIEIDGYGKEQEGLARRSKVQALRHVA